MKKTLIFAGISIFIAVALGAMGAHYLRETLEFPIPKIESWKTAVQYQSIHGLALFALAIIAHLFPKINLEKSITFIKIGMSLFAGSIYLLTMNYTWEIDLLPKIMGPLTPIGGLCMLIGWVLFIVNVSKTSFEK